MSIIQRFPSAKPFFIFFISSSVEDNSDAALKDLASLKGLEYWIGSAAFIGESFIAEENHLDFRLVV